MNKQEASKKISELLAQAQKLVYEAEGIADSHGVGFNMDLGGYGMGGYYEPVPDGADPDEEDKDYNRKYGWRASSHSC